MKPMVIWLRRILRAIAIGMNIFFFFYIPKSGIEISGPQFNNQYLLTFLFALLILCSSVTPILSVIAFFQKGKSVFRTVVLLLNVFAFAYPFVINSGHYLIVLATINITVIILYKPQLKKSVGERKDETDV